MLTTLPYNKQSLKGHKEEKLNLIGHKEEKLNLIPFYEKLFVSPPAPNYVPVPTIFNRYRMCVLFKFLALFIFLPQLKLILLSTIIIYVTLRNLTIL
jgi:hypothetical protein